MAITSLNEMSELMNQLIVLLGGTTIVLAGLFAFIGKIWLSRIIDHGKTKLEKELSELNENLNQTTKKLEAQLQSTVHINKIQFEHEFRIYQDVWSTLVDLRVATMGLRPTMDSIDPTQPKEERMRIRINTFSHSFNLFRDIVEKNKPFYAENVYLNLVAVLDNCFDESIDYEYTERKRTEYYREARDNQKKIITSIENACEAIRKRFQEVKVV